MGVRVGPPGWVPEPWSLCDYHTLEFGVQTHD